MIAFSTTIAKIAAASLTSPSSADTIPAMMSTTTKVAETCSHTMRHGFLPPRSTSSLGPYESSRRVTSSHESPASVFVSRRSAQVSISQACQCCADESVGIFISILTPLVDQTVTRRPAFLLK